jgi:hypothetical protein
MPRFANMTMLLTGLGAAAMTLGCTEHPSSPTPAPVVSPTTPSVPLTGNVLPVDRERVAEYGVPDLIGDVGLNGIVTYLRPHKGLWPRSGDTAHVYYYLDQKKTLYFAPGQAVRSQALSDDQVGFMRALAEGPRPVQR